MLFIVVWCLGTITSKHLNIYTYIHEGILYSSQVLWYVRSLENRLQALEVSDSNAPSTQPQTAPPTQPQDSTDPNARPPQPPPYSFDHLLRAVDLGLAPSAPTPLGLSFRVDIR